MTLTPRLLLPLLALAVGALAGCGHLELSSEGDAARVVTGEVSLGEPRPLPADAVVTVRVVVPAAAGVPGQVLGSQTISSAGVSPVPFRVEYRADDDLLRRGLNIEARVSWGGQLRYYNHVAYALNSGNASGSHRVGVAPAGP
jgi:uncharacterized lipoprotein YbaY